MNAVVQTAPSRIVSTTLHNLDIDQRICAAAAMPVDLSDLDRYLAELLAEIQARPQKREYRLAALTTEFGISLVQFFSQPDLTKNINSEALAQRLLRIELATENKYGHLNPSGAGHLKKGSFLQFIYREANFIHYLGVKVEHQLFLDEADFKRKIGMGESQKIYKACMVGFDSNGVVGDAVIFDTNSKPSSYWWRDFWELTEKRTDTHNTSNAIKEVVRVLAPLKNSSPADHTLLRNAAVTAFRSAGPMDFDKFITDVFATYQPINPAVTQTLGRMVDRMRELPRQKNFDNQFQLSPSAVPFRRVTFPITAEISLSYDEDMPNLTEKIWASRTRDGQAVLVIESSKSITERFTFKALE